jgi:Pao retrotransposon peptidase
LTALQPFGLAVPTLDLDRDELPVERTLGVHWDRQTDSFTFRIQNKLDKDTSVTKRVFLSVLMSVYDPLGLVAPIMFSMKSMLQETFVGEVKIDFDDELPEDLLRRFKEWYGALPHLEDVRVADVSVFQPGKWNSKSSTCSQTPAKKDMEQSPTSATSTTTVRSTRPSSWVKIHDPSS